MSNPRRDPVEPRSVPGTSPPGDVSRADDLDERRYADERVPVADRADVGDRGRADERAFVEERRPANDLRYRDDDRFVPGPGSAAMRDQVRWGPIVAGLVTALSVFLLLSLLAVGLGVAAAETTGVDDQAVMTTTTVVTAVIGLLAFVIGGFVAGRTAAIGVREAGGENRQAGALNGFLVWALGITLILALGAFGLGQLFGAAGQIFGELDQIQPGAVPEPDTSAIANSALIAFVSLALPAIAAAAGGWFGARQAEGDIQAPGA